jgi:hypothetical protein
MLVQKKIPVNKVKNLRRLSRILETTNLSYSDESRKLTDRNYRCN